MIFFFFALNIDLLCQTVGINRMDQCNLSDNVFYFVSLQMSDHMPFDILWHFLDFIAELLHLFRRNPWYFHHKFPEASQLVLFYWQRSASLLLSFFLRGHTLPVHVLLHFLNYLLTFDFISFAVVFIWSADFHQSFVPSNAIWSYNCDAISCTCLYDRIFLVLI